MDGLTLTILGVIFMLVIGLTVVLRLIVQEVTEDIITIKRRNRWRRRYRHRRRGR